MTSPARNPFHPTFGRSPAVFAGRDAELSAFELVLAEGPGNPWRTALISGARGIGKTVLLNEFEAIAKAQGWIVLRAHVGLEMITELTDITIPRVVRDLDFAPSATQRHITGVTLPGLGGVRTEVTTTPEPGRNLLTSLQDLWSLCAPHGVGLLITADEIQSAESNHLRELGHAIQELNRDDADIAFVAAGLPTGVEDLLQMDSTTFLRRAERVQLAPLSDETAAQLFRDTAALSTFPMDSGAIAAAVELGRGYPYLIQTIGSITWAKTKLAGTEVMTADRVAEASPEAIRRIGTQVHAPALRTATPAQMDFLWAMAQHGTPAATADIAEALGKKPSSISQLRHDLLYAELITAPAHGKVDFYLPYMGEYLLTLPR